jgi:3-(3-hydroxy-phenyl)propionate hydroxylase
VPDVPVRLRDGKTGHLLELIGGDFTLLYAKDGAPPTVPDGIGLMTVGEHVIDATGAFAQRFDAKPGTAYLLRPDQHVCARWRAFNRNKISAARARALGG